MLPDYDADDELPAEESQLRVHPLRAVLVLVTITALVVIFIKAGVLAGVGVMFAQAVVMFGTVAVHDRVRTPLQRLVVLIPSLVTVLVIIWAVTLLAG